MRQYLLPPNFLPLALSVLMTVSPARAEQAGQAGRAGEARELGAQIQRCFTVSLQAKGRVVIAFDADAAGAVSNPRVVLGGEGEAEKLLAEAGRRAILRCAPYKLRQAGEVRVSFVASTEDGMAGVDIAPAAPSTAEPATQPESGSASEPADVDTTRLRSFSYQGLTVRLEAPAGYCRIDPEASEYDRVVWNAMDRPSSAKEVLLALDIDCASFEAARAGRPGKPKSFFYVIAPTGEPDVTVPLGDFLASVHARQVQRIPSTKRFWQSPPIGGTAVVGLDERAVYVANRKVEASGEVSVSGISGLTMLRGKQFMLNLFDGDGTNMRPELPALMTQAVARLHELSK